MRLKNLIIHYVCGTLGGIIGIVVTYYYFKMRNWGGVLAGVLLLMFTIYVLFFL